MRTSLQKPTAGIKKFLGAAFYITWFQLLVIGFFAGLKYLLVEFGLTEKIQKPFFIVFFSSLLLLVVAVAITGIIEKRTRGSYEAWETKKQDRKNRLLIFFINWALIIPGVLAYVLCAYLFAPDSFLFFMALLAGIVIRNGINYFASKEEQLNDNPPGAGIRAQE